MVCVSSGTSERTSTTSQSMPCSALSFSAAASARGTISASARMVASLPGRTIFGGAERVDDLAVGHFALGRIERLVLEENHRVGIADGRGEQPDDVARRSMAPPP